MSTQQRANYPPRREGAGPRRQYGRRRKVCKFCLDKIDHIDYKDVKLLAQFIQERGKITPARISGVCMPHQKKLARSIKRARNIAFLPFASEI